MIFFKKEEPKKIVHYLKIPNGCGSYGINLDLNFGELNINECCHDHDVCYGTCNSDRKQCDKELYNCTLLACKNYTNYAKYIACKGLAKIMYRVTRMGGCSAYQKDQELACHC